MQKVYTFLLLFIAVYSAKAQNASEYFFSTKSNVVLEDVSGATGALSTGVDETPSAAIDFPFKFNNQTFNQLFVTPNGVVTLGQPSEFYPDVNILKESPVYPIIAAWGDDLFTASNGGVVYKITGTEPYRRLVIDWKVRKFTRNNLAGYDKHFQLWLFETTNKIQFVYGAGFVDEYNAAPVGIAGSETNFVSINVAAGTASTSVSDLNENVWPGEGMSYVFAPSKVEPLQVANNGIVANVSCNGSKNGYIQLGTITGGEGSSKVSWTGPNGFTASGTAINNLAGGVYSYVITDAQLSLNGSIEVKEPVAVTLSVQATNANCVTGMGSIAVTTNGRFIITDKLGNDVTGKTTFAPGTYTVIASADALQSGSVCTSAPVVVTIAAPVSFDASVAFFPEYTVANQQAHTIYLGYGAQSVQLSVAGLANQNYNYSWSPALGLSKPNAAVTDASPIATTTYQVTITNASGCSITRSVVVNVIDVRSGKKIIVCKKGKTETTDVKDVEKALEKDAVLGACTQAAQPAARAVSAGNEVVFIKNAVKVYPNPSAGKFNLTIKDASVNTSIQIVDINGRVVAARKLSATVANQNVAFDLTGKAEGLYLIKVFTGTAMETAKLIIKR